MQHGGCNWVRTVRSVRCQWHGEEVVRGHTHKGTCIANGETDKTDLEPELFRVMDASTVDCEAYVLGRPSSATSVPWSCTATSTSPPPTPISQPLAAQNVGQHQTLASFSLRADQAPGTTRTKAMLEDTTMDTMVIGAAERGNSRTVSGRERGLGTGYGGQGPQLQPYSPTIPQPQQQRPGIVCKRGGGILDKTHPPNFGRTHPTFDPPRTPPPPLINLWGAFFVNKIEAKALSRVRQPQRVTH